MKIASYIGLLSKRKYSMTRKFPLSLSLLFLIVCSQASANDGASLEDLFLKQAQPNQLQSLSNQLHVEKTTKGDFTQYRKLKVLKKPLISKGKFIFKQDLGIAWLQLTPFQTSIILMQGNIIQKDSQGQIRVTTADQTSKANVFSQEMPKLMNALLTGNLQQLNKQFKLFYKPAAQQQWQLGLIPLDQNIRKAIPKMVLSGKHHIDSLVLLNNNGDTTRIEFDNLSNQSLTTKELAYFNFEVN